MNDFDFDDTNSSGIWWSTNLAIRDACVGLKNDTNCSDKKIGDLLRHIAKSIEEEGAL
tara:strand:- start:19050 stop:19223 length:174 start_codon:yes stop_codon:yes gene_type:complete